MAKKTIINPILAGNQLANSPLCSCSGLFRGRDSLPCLWPALNVFFA